MSRTAIVLFNLGGPDGPESIQPFRINLFSDKAIIRAPFFIRLPLARYIAGTSARTAAKNYAYMGSKSPLLEFTTQQAEALEGALGGDVKTFIAMRYWHPFAAEAVRAVKAYDPDRILLLPLYPQFSSTTTGSSLNDWHEAAAAAGLAKPTTTLCCYPTDPAYIAALVRLLDADIAEARAALPEGTKLRLLFSAHGLPESIVKAGDPYQEQIEATTAAVIAGLADRAVEYQVCYQSRATPQQWLTPSTIDAIIQAGLDRVAVMLVPIAFVSDHIETLVELDIENRELSVHHQLPGYFRARVPNADPDFILALAGLAHRALGRGNGVFSFAGGRVCGQSHKSCPCRQASGGDEFGA
jgi:protoporphyrin/coproporphyrin ferrochelatase